MPRPNPGPRLVKLSRRANWYIRWTENERSRERSTDTTDDGEAQGALEAFLAGRRRRGGPRDPAAFPVLDALNDYAEERAPETSAPARIAYAIDALADHWAGLTVSEITKETCASYQAGRGVAAGTVRRELGVLRAALNHAHKHGRLTRTVFVWMPPKPEGRDRWLRRKEAAALLRAARRDRRARLHLPLFILIGLYTGARKEAILSLRWHQVDLDRGRINFNPPGRPRTSKGRPIIPIPRRLMIFLRLARCRGVDLGYVVNRHGRRIGDIKRSFRTACNRAGLADVVPHTLRHTAGTWMAQRGVPMWEIAGYLGHSHERTAALYSHHHPDHLALAKGAFD